MSRLIKVSKVFIYIAALATTLFLAPATSAAPFACGTVVDGQPIQVSCIRVVDGSQQYVCADGTTVPYGPGVTCPGTDAGSSAAEPGCYLVAIGTSSPSYTKTACDEPRQDSGVASGNCYQKAITTSGTGSSFSIVDCSTIPASAVTNASGSGGGGSGTTGSGGGGATTSSGSSGSRGDGVGDAAAPLVADASKACDPRTADGASTELTPENCSIIEYLVVAINFLSGAAGLAIVGSVMFSGYMYMTARDNSGQIEAAKKRIIWSITALGMLIFTYAFLNWLVPGGVI